MCRGKTQHPIRKAGSSVMKRIVARDLVCFPRCPLRDILLDMATATKKYNEVTKTRLDPESAMLEVCPRCRARPGKFCKTATGRKAKTHVERVILRAEREIIMYEPANYSRVVRRRQVNAKKKEKRPNKEKYMIRGTKVSETWLSSPKPKRKKK